MFHQPGRQGLDREVFRERVTAFTVAPGRVVDGNYSAVRDIVWGPGRHGGLVDPPRHRVMRQLI